MIIEPIVQVIENEGTVGNPPVPSGKPDMGLLVDVQAAVRILLKYVTPGGKEWWKCIIKGENSDINDWEDAPGNIGWESSEAPSDDAANKIWAGLRPLLQEEHDNEVPTHDVWFIENAIVDGNTITGPDMNPAVGFDDTHLYISARTKANGVMGLWTGKLSAGQGANATAWLAANPDLGFSGAILPAGNSDTTRKLVKVLAVDVAHRKVKYMGREPNET